MINVRRLTVIAFLGAGLLPGISAQESSVQTAAQSEMNLPPNGIYSRASTMRCNRTLRFAKTG